MSEPEPAGPQTESAPAQAAGTLGFGALLAGLGIAALVLLLDVHALERASALCGLAQEPHPYFRPEHGLLLYVRVPLAVVCACVTCLGPGLLLTLPRVGVRDTGMWLLKGFAASVMLLAVLAPLADAAAGEEFLGRGWVLLLAASSAVVAGVRYTLWRRSGASTPTLLDPSGAALLWTAVAACWLLTAALVPKLLWESFNGDGAHGFEACRVLLRRPVPFFGADAGDLGLFPGMTSFVFAYPGSWFLRLFGEIEAAARVPVLLYLVLLVGGVTSLARWGRSIRLGAAALLPTWGWASVYLVALAFSATYSPYSADLALPATQDTMFMACALGMILAILASEKRWTAVFVTLLVLGMPSGLLLIACWVLGWVLTTRPIPRRRLVRLGVIVAGCVAITALLPAVFTAAGWPVPGGEYRAAGLLGRFKVLQFTHLQRFAYVAVPAGIVPVAALLVWKRQDPVARSLTIAAAVYFALFYFQGNVSLHHFVPAMVLPWPVALRLGLGLEPRRRMPAYVAALAACAVSMWLAVPPDTSPFVESRRIGLAVEDRTGSYLSDHEHAFLEVANINAVFPEPHDLRVPHETFGLSEAVVLFYSHGRGSQAGEPCYLLLPLDAEPPEGARRVEAEGAGMVALYVLDEERNAAFQALRPGAGRIAPVLRVPRGILFRGLPLEPGLRTFRPGRWVRRLLGREEGGR